MLVGSFESSSDGGVELRSIISLGDMNRVVPEEDPCTEKFEVVGEIFASEGRCCEDVANEVRGLNEGLVLFDLGAGGFYKR